MTAITKTTKAPAPAYPWKRREGEIDRFQWYCRKCDTLLHEEIFIVRDYAEDPVSKAYRRFFDNEEFRTCRQCGDVMPTVR